jgi:hypothetical protein
MTNSKQNESDILRKYINSERIEEAPEGFTEKVMARIQVQGAPVRITGKFRLNVLVPVISCIITLSLIVLTIIFSSPSDNSLFPDTTKFLRNLNLTLPEIKMDIFSGSSLPALVIYIAIGLIMLSLFDKALKRLFHK